MTTMLVDRRGAVLVEFALVALVMTLLLAATTDLGRLVFTAQVIQDAARAGARELAVTPLPVINTDTSAPFTFDDALTDPNVRARVFDSSLLAIDITAPMNDGTFDLGATCAALPVINRVLCPLMIVDSAAVPGVTLLRYPGALLTTATGFSVAIPRVVDRNPASGVETIDWVGVVEEMRSDPVDPSTGPFVLAPSVASSGLVALRINYPFQAAAMSGFRPNPAGSLEPNGTNVNIADDAAVSAPPPPFGDLLSDDGVSAGTYAGPYGLGRQYAFAGKTVRPFRRLIAAQAVFRREVFQQEGATP